jgi:hypothetical protein
MRDFNKIPPSLWQNKTFVSLSDRERLAYLYIMSSPHQTSIGCCYMPAAYASADLRWSVSSFEKTRDTLVERGLILFDAQTHEIAIVDWFATNAPANHSHRRGVVKAIAAVKSGSIGQALKAALDEAAPDTFGPLEQVRHRNRQQPLVMPINGGKR